MRLPQIYFGSTDAAKPDWRKALKDEPYQDDDSILDPTPEDVMRLLGLDPLELFGPKGGGGKKKRLALYRPVTKAARDASDRNEKALADAIGGTCEAGASLFDIIVGGDMIDCWTIIGGSGDRITVHPESLQRKLGNLKASGGRGHTVVFDDRNGRLLYRVGVGSILLADMQELRGGPGELGRLLGVGKASGHKNLGR